MGRHMMQQAAVVDLDNPRLKLALMCFAESARDTDRIAFPGDVLLLKWTGVKKSQLHNLINRLIEMQLLERTQRACRARRAEYRLFPLGCCVAHGKTVAQVAGDTADVVVIGLSTGPADHAQPVEPLPGEWVQSTDPNGSNREPEWVQSPSVKSTPSFKHSKEPSPGSTTDLQPLTPREAAPAVSIEFVDPQPARGVRVVTPSGKPLGCRHCDAGFVTDLDGLPVAKCQHCHPAARQRSEGRTA